MFGITLTRHRSRLHVTALTNLAELRMHLRDEHLHNGTKRKRYARNITTHANPPHATASSGPVAPPAAAAEHNEPVDDMPTAPPSESFRETIDHLIQSVEEDENDEGASFCEKKVKISEMFDFQNPHWQAITRAHTMRSLREEMEAGTD